MIKPTILKNKTLTIDNRTFLVVGIWFKGLKASSYELREIKDGKDIGGVFKKEAKIINQLVGQSKITVI